MKKTIMTAVFSAILMLILPLTVWAMDYQHKIEAENISFAWTIEGDLIHVQLSAKTEGWVAVGFEPEDVMAGADIIIGMVTEGQVKIQDNYGDRKKDMPRMKTWAAKMMFKTPPEQRKTGSPPFPLPSRSIAGTNMTSPFPPAGQAKSCWPTGPARIHSKTAIPMRWSMKSIIRPVKAKRSENETPHPV